jgi:hypothetical protein
VDGSEGENRIAGSESGLSDRRQREAVDGRIAEGEMNVVVDRMQEAGLNHWMWQEDGRTTGGRELMESDRRRRELLGNEHLDTRSYA